jgi:hypothetical protein
MFFRESKSYIVSYLWVLSLFFLTKVVVFIGEIKFTMLFLTTFLHRATNCVCHHYSWLWYVYRKKHGRTRTTWMCHMFRCSTDVCATENVRGTIQLFYAPVELGELHMQDGSIMGTCNHTECVMCCGEPIGAKTLLW